jgi:fyn-related kinase
MEVNDFINEANLMKKLLHPNLLQLYAVCSLEEPIYIVTVLMRHGRLLEYLQRGDGRHAKLHQSINMMAEIASGMAYLEEHSYIHRDLTAQNIQVGEDRVCKVAEFRLARLIKEDIYNAPGGEKFPLRWTAPEAALYNRYSTKSDVWSFGILIHEIWTKGAIPYPGMEHSEVIEKVEAGYRMPKPVQCPDRLYNIMRSTWNREPERRPTFKYLKELLNYLVLREPIYKEPGAV